MGWDEPDPEPELLVVCVAGRPSRVVVPGAEAPFLPLRDGVRGRWPEVGVIP